MDCLDSMSQATELFELVGKLDEREELSVEVA